MCFYYHIPSELDGRAMPIDVQLLHTYVQLCTVATYYLLCFYAALAFWDGTVRQTSVAGAGGADFGCSCSFKCDLSLARHFSLLLV